MILRIIVSSSPNMSSPGSFFFRDNAGAGRTLISRTEHSNARKDQMWAFIDDHFYKLFNLSLGGDVTESNAVLAKE